jgi:hypothetical protein
MQRTCMQNGDAASICSMDQQHGQTALIQKRHDIQHGHQSFYFKDMQQGHSTYLVHKSANYFVSSLIYRISRSEI